MKLVYCLSMLVILFILVINNTPWGKEHEIICDIGIFVSVLIGFLAAFVHIEDKDENGN